MKRNCEMCRHFKPFYRQLSGTGYLLMTEYGYCVAGKRYRLADRFETHRRCPGGRFEMCPGGVAHPRRIYTDPARMLELLIGAGVQVYIEQLQARFFGGSAEDQGEDGDKKSQEGDDQRNEGNP